MHRLSKSAIVIAVLAFAWSVAMAASPAALSAPAVLNDVGNNNTYETDGLPRSGIPPHRAMPSPTRLNGHSE